MVKKTMLKFIELWSLVENGGPTLTPEIAKSSLTKTKSKILLSRVGTSTYWLKPFSIIISRNFDNFLLDGMLKSPQTIIDASQLNTLLNSKKFKNIQKNSKINNLTSAVFSHQSIFGRSCSTNLSRKLNPEIIKPYDRLFQFCSRSFFVKFDT